MKSNKENTAFKYAGSSKQQNQEPKFKGGPGSSMNRVTSKEKRSFSDIVKTLSKLFTYFNQYKIVLILGLILACASSILMMIGPNLIGKMADLIQNGLSGNIDLYNISNLAYILLTVYGLSALFSFIQQYLMAGMTANICKSLRSKFIKKLNKLPFSYFNTHLQGDILSRITNDIQTLRTGISRCIPGLTKAIAQFATCIVMMIITEWHLTLCVYSVVIIGLIVVVLIMKFSQKYFDQRQTNIGSLNGLIEEMYTGYQIIKMSQAKKEVLNKFNEGNYKLYKSDYMSQFISGLMIPLMIVIGNFAILSVIVVGSILAINGLISFGAIAAFLLYCNYCTQPLTRISQNLTDLQGVCAATSRLFKFYEAEEIPETSNFEFNKKTLKGNIEFKNVQFSYPSNPNKTIIKDFSAKIKHGQKIAIVGKTGAGKTTLVNLLMRFYDIGSGQILIDDTPINKIKRSDIHDIFGMVLQDTWLFQGTIKENLVYNMEDISDEKIIEVCKTCGIYEFVNSLPYGFDTEISESLNISAGQKQLITIARAMLQNAPMLILDEATSSVDTKTEKEIQKSMDILTEGRTSFVIAHRLSTISNADLILVIDNGDIVESGNHDQLLKLKGKYSELYNSQFQEV